MFRFMPICNGFLAVVLCLLPLIVYSDEPPAVAAASSTQAALEEIATQFHDDTGKTVRLSFGSSGNIYRQIIQGAPFELFFSADETYVRQLAEADRTAAEALYATGRIVLFAPLGAPFDVDEQGSDLKTALADGRIQRFAIANPAHAPYGRAAQEVLQSLSLWEAIKTKLVLGENVSQAAQFATSGSTQGGIFAYSLALTPNVSKQGKFVLLPEHLHQPLRQHMTLLKNAGATAQAFYRYVQQPKARAVFDRYGFILPDA